MKKQFLGLLCFVCATSAYAQINTYTLVTNYWYQGQISNVLSIANARLAQNSNDIAGLILKMECDLAFLDLPNVSNSIWRVYHVGQTIQSTNFATRFADEEGDFFDILEKFKTYPTPQQIESERAKAFYKGKSLPTGLLRALQKDGYFD